jgi:hypothetical protein
MAKTTTECARPNTRSKASAPFVRLVRLSALGTLRTRHAPHSARSALGTLRTRHAPHSALRNSLIIKPDPAQSCLIKPSTATNAFQSQSHQIKPNQTIENEKRTSGQIWPTSHEPGNSDGAVGARFVPNRSADVGTGAEPTQTRGLAERCELGQLALRRQGRFRAGGQVQMEQATSHEHPERRSPTRLEFVSLRV